MTEAEFARQHNLNQELVTEIKDGAAILCFFNNYGKIIYGKSLKLCNLFL